MRAFVILAVFVGLVACGKDSTPTTESARTGDPQRGRSIYLSNCIACHNTDPSKDGPIGPAINGSSRTLIEARLLRAGYPPGYIPKRQTALMPAQPHLKSAIPDLAAFLSDFQETASGSKQDHEQQK